MNGKGRFAELDGVVGGRRGERHCHQRARIWVTESTKIYCAGTAIASSAGSDDLLDANTNSSNNNMSGNSTAMVASTTKTSFAATTTPPSSNGLSVGSTTGSNSPLDESKSNNNNNDNGGGSNDSSVGDSSKIFDEESGEVEDNGEPGQLAFLQRQFQVAQRRERVLTTTYAECERITRLYAKTFALGCSFMSRQKRTAVWAIYVWCRRTDDLVDGPRVEQRSSSLRDVLAAWERRLDDVFSGHAHDALDLALVDTIKRYPAMDPQPFRDMIAGMLMDVEQDRFATFDDLYLYCYRVAGTVGLMTLPVMGSADGTEATLERARDAALSLGVALQLTNILRDVGEDRLRGRIYLPLEDLRRFGYTEAELMNCVLDSRYQKLMQFQIERARDYFKKAESGIDMLSVDARLPVRASLDMYRRILDVIEENGYDNFNKRAYVSKNQKISMLPVCWMRTQPRNSIPYRIADALFPSPDS